MTSRIFFGVFDGLLTVLDFLFIIDAIYSIFGRPARKPDAPRPKAVTIEIVSAEPA
ncbi:MAG: hypothetical protein AAFZ09_14490 [Pseudomonadota bacterium]